LKSDIVKSKIWIGRGIAVAFLLLNDRCPMPDARFQDSRKPAAGASPVLHLSRSLTDEPAVRECEGVVLRCFADERDIAAWLALRERAFADQRPPVGKWTAADFEREFLDQSWWRPDRMWLAHEVRDNEVRDNGQPCVGSVTLALRKRPAGLRPAIHWLMVDPAHRRCGIGRLLVAAAESAAWHDGFRDVHLETHAGWTAALALYRAMGYLPNRADGKQQKDTTADVADVADERG
jgi:GNAT superfamily N-acetyltransferase